MNEGVYWHMFAVNTMWILVFYCSSYGIKNTSGPLAALIFIHLLTRI